RNAPQHTATQAHSTHDNIQLVWVAVVTVAVVTKTRGVSGGVEQQDTIYILTWRQRGVSKWV
ncbi:hypothetical protein OAM67_01565, partial [bacterium]|nr:hypothetical protein [bacterium]